MVETDDGRIDDAPLSDPLIQTERLAFDAQDLVACDECGRLNPPNRFKCLYCSHGLQMSVENAESVDLNLRKLELWERGFNIIFSGNIGDTMVDTAKAAKLLSLEPSEVEAILIANVPLPLARVESLSETSALIQRLLQLGIAAAVVSDDELTADKPPVRLSRVDFLDGRFAFTAFNTGRVTEFDAADIGVIVPGIVIVGKVDSIEKKGRRGKTTLVDETETTADERVLDLYSWDDPIGFRVQLTGFDFSCLGPDKGLLAAENLRRLIARLREHSPGARYIEDYNAFRPILDPIWQVEMRKDSKGLQRSGFGKREFGNISSRNNLNQFTKFSRLQWQMYERDQKEKG